MSRILWQSTVNRILDCFEFSMTWCVKFTGPTFVVLGVSLLLGGVYTVLYGLLPILNLPPYIHYTTLIILCHLAILIFFNYFWAVTAHPGTSDPFQEENTVVFENEFDEQTSSIDIKDERRVKCKKCSKFKPLRTHHCSVCNKCILKMDHHCTIYSSLPNRPLD
jgi:hypothetical protein